MVFFFVAITNIFMMVVKIKASTIIKQNVCDGAIVYIFSYRREKKIDVLIFVEELDSQDRE